MKTKWLKDESEFNFAIQSKDTVILFTLPEARLWRGKVDEAITLLEEGVADEANILLLDPAAVPGLCETHQIMHMFTILAFKHGLEVDRMRVSELNQMGRFLARNLSNPNIRIVERCVEDICREEYVVGAIA